jgi:Uma2 family endonuclease
MTQAARGMTPDAFLEWERAQSERHFFVRGEVFAKAGGSPRHSALAARVIGQLSRTLAGKPCDVHTSDLRLAVADDQFVYADAVVVCRPITLRAGSSDVVTNPSVVVEVLSHGTEAYDRGDKQAAYLALASVKNLVLVSQREARVEVYSRQENGGFHFEVYGPADVAQLDGVGATLALSELYACAFELPGDQA